MACLRTWFDYVVELKRSLADPSTLRLARMGRVLGSKLWVELSLERHLRLERSAADLRGEVVAVREGQHQDVVEVADELLDHPATVEARRAWV